MACSFPVDSAPRPQPIASIRSGNSRSQTKRIHQPIPRPPNQPSTPQQGTPASSGPCQTSHHQSTPSILGPTPLPPTSPRSPRNLKLYCSTRWTPHRVPRASTPRTA
ncbi:hypothetical protein EJ04DRAFT_525627 [Polyplosphaeria fusca]|uniref:Uncharacterized protein n=1 Tax=Polyplosphaeria fusca TaxID=682080 RepID=A0A9P4QWB3_9PLEO|nr:hypothetical protein EJ04DRAFT_525627 [Polyplosphaeria fusca]